MKESAESLAKAHEERAPAWPFLVWLAAMFLLLFICVVISTAWAVRHAIQKGPLLSEAQSRVVMYLAEFPGMLITVGRELPWRLKGEPFPLLMDRSATEKPFWVSRFPCPEDNGFLLFSGIDPIAKHSIVKLIRISDGEVVAQWDPDWQAIFKSSNSKTFAPVSSLESLRAKHPLLLADGDIIFSTGAALVRLSPCASEPVWVLDEPMHHSLEFDLSGAIWGSSILQQGFTDNPWIRDRVRDNSLALISTEGQLLENRSFARILLNNGMQALLLGTFGLRINEDPIHLNQITVATSDSRYWHRGDLLISARHLSTVFLYRPSNDKIIWHKTGPWMNQHSVDFVDEHRISVFDNNIVSALPNEYAFMSPDEINRVFLFDFETGHEQQPFVRHLEEARPKTITEGRARVLPDGGLFVEETEFGRHLRFSRDRLLWSRVNVYDRQRIGIVSWSRYLTAEEVRTPLQALAARQREAKACAVKNKRPKK
jgi:hypothetical protein